MKIHLITTIAIASLMVTSCSKDKGVDTDTEGAKTTLGNDSLVTRLSLKISDKSNLMIKSQLFKDSRGSYIISGEKDKKYWIGYFDKSGNQIFTKTYIDDPTQMTITGGSVIQLPYTRLFGSIKEIGSFIFINRSLRRSADVSGQNEQGFVENLTQINTTTNAITSTYSNIVFGGEVPFTARIDSWYNGSYVIVKMLALNSGENGKITNFLYDAAGKLIVNEFPGDNNGLAWIEGIIPVSLTDYLKVTGNSVSRISLTHNTATEFKTSIFAEVSPAPGVTSYSVAQNILTVVGKVINQDKSERTVTVSVDINTGRIIQ